MKQKYSFLAFLALVSMSFSSFSGGKDHYGNPLTRETLFGIIDGDETTAGDIAELGVRDDMHGYYENGTNVVSPNAQGNYVLIDNAINKIAIPASPSLVVDLIFNVSNVERLVEMSSIEFSQSGRYVTSARILFNPDSSSGIGRGAMFLPTDAKTITGQSGACYYSDSYLVDGWNVDIAFELSNATEGSINANYCQWNCNLFVNRQTQSGDWEYETYYWQGFTSVGKKIVIEIPSRTNHLRDFILDFKSPIDCELTFIPHGSVVPGNKGIITYQTKDRYIHFLDRPGRDEIFAYDMLDFNRGNLIDSVITRGIGYETRTNEVSVVVKHESSSTELATINNSTTSTVVDVNRSYKSSSVEVPTGYTYRAGTAFPIPGLATVETNVAYVPYSVPMKSLNVFAPFESGHLPMYLVSSVKIGGENQSFYVPDFHSDRIWVGSPYGIRFGTDPEAEENSLGPIYDWWKAGNGLCKKVTDWYSNSFTGGTFRNFGDMEFTGNLECGGSIVPGSVNISSNITVGGDAAVSGWVMASEMDLTVSNVLDGIVSASSGMTMHTAVDEIVPAGMTNAVIDISTEIASSVMFKPTVKLPDTVGWKGANLSTDGRVIITPVNNSTMYVHIWDNNTSSSKTVEKFATHFYIDKFPLKESWKSNEDVEDFDNNHVMYKILFTSPVELFPCLAEHSYGYGFTFNPSTGHGWKIVCEDPSTIFSSIPANTPTMFTFEQLGPWNGWANSLIKVSRKALHYRGQN